jgi:hypothetical protein
MKNNSKLVMQKPFDVNPFTKLWKTLSSSQIFVEKILKYIKSAELVIEKIIGSVEDEQCFFMFTFMKIKL